jgi:hypothetical protein
MGAKEIQKNQKNGKPVHGVMICDIIPWKNTKHGILRFHRKTLHKNATKEDFTWLSTQLSLVYASSIANF